MLMKTQTAAVDPGFSRDVLKGLGACPKSLPSRYFYDARGDRIFQAIMASPEYYLTDCELEIIETQGSELAQAMVNDEPCELIELGSGDGLKTRLLLDALHRHHQNCVYKPIDISGHSLELLRNRIVPGRPWLDFQPIEGNYFNVLSELKRGNLPRVFMFLGSNLGNFTMLHAVAFLRLIRQAMAPGDALLIGLDLKKDPALIRAAYDDAAGHTREFNLNLLHRINRELGGDFDIDAFEHHPEYDPDSGAAKSYLRSMRAQEVYISVLNRSFTFAASERVFTEISQKYDQRLIRDLVGASGFRVKAAFFDSRRYFSNQIWI